MSRTKQIPKESPARRFRAVLYHLWEKDNDGFEEFNDYYNDRMEKLIDHYSKQSKRK